MWCPHRNGSPSLAQRARIVGDVYCVLLQNLERGSERDQLPPSEGWIINRQSR